MKINSENKMNTTEKIFAAVISVAGIIVGKKLVDQYFLEKKVVDEATFDQKVKSFAMKSNVKR